MESAEEGAKSRADRDALETNPGPLEALHPAFDRLVVRTKDDATAQLEREAAALPIRFGRCPLCGLAGGVGDAAMIVRESEHALVVLNRFPTRPGQLLVVLRRHVESYLELAWPEQLEVQRLAWEGARTIERVFEPTRVYLASFGTPAKLLTSNPHHHQHVTPIFTRDERDRPAKVFSWSAGLYAYRDGRAHETADAVRTAWADDVDMRTLACPPPAISPMSPVAPTSAVSAMSRNASSSLVRFPS